MPNAFFHERIALVTLLAAPAGVENHGIFEDQDYKFQQMMSTEKQFKSRVLKKQDQTRLDNI